jgi:hypothetical protein
MVPAPFTGRISIVGETKKIVAHYALYEKYAESGCYVVGSLEAL